MNAKYPVCGVCQSEIIDLTQLPNHLGTWRLMVMAPGDTTGPITYLCGSCMVELAKMNIVLYKRVDNGNEKQSGEV